MAARINNYKIDPTQELIAIGVSNIVSSFVSSYPVTGSFSRTAVNSQSGVRTPAGGSSQTSAVMYPGYITWRYSVCTGVLILLALQFLMPYCHYIPKAALAAVIIMAVLPMFDYRMFLSLWRTSKWDLFIHVVTFILSFVIGIEYGILIGIGLSLLLLLYPMARPKLQVSRRQGVVIVQPDQGLFFPAVEYVEEKVMEAALEDEKPKSVVVDMRSVYGVDYTTVQSIKSLLAEAARRDVTLVFCNMRSRVVKYLLKADIADLKMYNSLSQALQQLTLQEDAETAEPLHANEAKYVAVAREDVGGGVMESMCHGVMESTPPHLSREAAQ
ncbi:hypothetical protein C0Q70_00034 [Pomacea canaliculata]|uniref:STAS domain-containing protein n=1 Tax=Pomacea canaliculata TaxID=400727 RepID=A0A2T7PVJ2_POMCA|nr:hypothetical protein C0Q70_00034 [Pomacea canaliculata]